MAMMVDAIKKALSSYDGKWNEKKGLLDFSATIAERKAFLSKKQLTYSCKMRIDDGARIVRFSEVLMEAGSGFSSGGFDSDMSSGFGMKKETYNTFSGSRQGTIEEQSSLFGKNYTYRFNYQEIREKVRSIVENAGYRFEYQILPVK
jgi:hypothetical protein